MNFPPRIFPILLVLLLAGFVMAPLCAETNEQTSQHSTTGIDGKTSQERAAAFFAYCAEAKPKKEFYAKEAMIYYVARILAGKETEFAIKEWQQTLSRTLEEMQNVDPTKPPRLDPFDKQALVWAWILCHDKVALPPDILENTKKYVSLWQHREWKGYGALNYRLMMDGSGYLAAQECPDLVDASGLKADEIMGATKARLMGYFHEIVTRNTHEYGSPTYLGVDLSAMKMLADHVRDPDLKNAARLTLDAMFLQLAAAWNHGYLITTCGRSKYWSPATSSPDDMDATATCAWVFWGGERPVVPEHLCAYHSGWFSLPVPSGERRYAPPALFEKIAQERSRNLTMQASALFGGQQVRTTIYQTPSYGLASQWEEFSSPKTALCKETHRQMFKWVSPMPASTFIPLQQNLQRPYVESNTKANAFGYGENPYTQVLQSEGTLIAISDVDPSYPYWKIYAPFTTQGAILKRIEKNGWVLCHGGSVLFAFRTLKPSTWGKPEDGCDILWSDDRKNGWVLETSPIASFAGGGVDAELERFSEAVSSKVMVDDSGLEAAIPSLKVKNLEGRELSLIFRPIGTSYTDQHRIDGRVVEYHAFPLIGTPWGTQAVDSDKLDLALGGEAVHYDFKNWSRSENGVMK